MSHKNELDDVQNVENYLRKNSLITEIETINIQELEGGVSSKIWKIETGKDKWVLKQALPKLEVELEWYSDPERIYREQEAMWVIKDLLPEGTVPSIVHSDNGNYLYMMTFAPEDAVNWKELMLNGKFNNDTAYNSGQLLRKIHKNSTKLTPKQRSSFYDLTYFEQLRIEPFHKHLIKIYPELANDIERLIKELKNDKTCLVHGDYSPKNILVDSNNKLVILDYEVAHWGNPVYDLSFCIAHLMLKGWGLDRKDEAKSVIHSFLNGYKRSFTNLVPHLGLMLLARLDGKSPVNYLENKEIEQEIRNLSISWIKEINNQDSVKKINEALKGESTL